MKKQCETILLWQEDVQRVHDSHKAKFEETKQYIEKVSGRRLIHMCVVLFSIKGHVFDLSVADGEFKVERRAGAITAEREGS